VPLPGSLRSSPFLPLFSPPSAGYESPSLPSQLHTAVSSADRDLRSRLYESVVLAGGTTQAHGFGQRLLAELRERAPPHAKVRITAPAGRAESAWVGGSILASLSTFGGMWVSRERWLEEGEGAVRVRML
jgi:actin-related protein